METKRKVIAIFLIICLSLVVIPSMPVYAEETYQIKLYATKDSYCDADHTSTNYGTTDELYLKGYLNGGDRRCFWYFDLMTLPAGTILNATLYMYQTECNGEHGVSIYRITEDWDEYTIDWDDMPSVGANEAFTLYNQAAWVNFDVTDECDTIAGFYGLSMRGSEDAIPAKTAHFYSREKADYEPYLIVYLEAGAVGTTTVTTWGDGAQVTGGSIFDVMATNSSETASGSGCQVDTYMYNLQHMHVATTLFMNATWNSTSNDWDCPSLHTETGYLKYGISYLASDGEEIISGWYCKIEVTDGDATNDTTAQNWVELSIEWYSQQELVKSDLIYCAFEAYYSTDITKQISLYVDLWLSSDTDNTRVGGAVSSKYYGMYEDGWWLWSSWTPKLGLQTLSTFYDDLYDENGTVSYSYDYTTFVAWTEIGKVAEGESDLSLSCDNHYWATQVTSLEFICPAYGATLYGINTPVLMPTTTPDSPLGFFATLGNSIVDALNDMSYALQTAFSGLSSYSSSAVDDVFDSFGVEDFSTNIATFIGNVGGEFGSAVSVITNLVGSIFDIIAGLGMFIITWTGKIFTSLITLFDTMIDIMDGTNPAVGATQDLFYFLEQLWSLEDMWGFVPTLVLIGWMLSLDNRVKKFGVGWMSLMVTDVQNFMSILSFLMDVAWRIVNVVIDLISRFIFWWI